MLLTKQFYTQTGMEDWLEENEDYDNITILSQDWQKLEVRFEVEEDDDEEEESDDGSELIAGALGLGLGLLGSELWKNMGGTTDTDSSDSFDGFDGGSSGGGGSSDSW